MTSVRPGKIVKRKCNRTQDRGRPIVVCLDSYDVLYFRRAGCRIAYTLPVSVCYYLAAKAYAHEVKRLRAEKRKNRRSLKCNIS